MRTKKASSRLGRPTASALRVHQMLRQTPLIRIADAAQELKISAPTATKAIRHMETLGILR